MVNDKADRCNSFPYEFYKAFWDSIRPNLHKVYLEYFHSISLSNLINKGNIKFILKSNNSEDIYILRLVFLLNISYKIIAKALMLKIQHLLPLVVRPKKTPFIKSHYIQDNIIVV